jgi:mannose-6-phosphate isomerase-like protein (cupin superfamily)
MAIHIPKEIIDETLRQPALHGKRNTEPLKSFSKAHGASITILEDTDVVNDAEVHMHEADLWGCIDGEVTFLCGGELVDSWYGKRADGSDNPNELKAKTIKGGTEIIVKAGDWLQIPAGEPHQHSCEGTARLFIIKIPKVG